MGDEKNKHLENLLPLQELPQMLIFLSMFMSGGIGAMASVDVMCLTPEIFR